MGIAVNSIKENDSDYYRIAVMGLGIGDFVPAFLFTTFSILVFRLEIEPLTIIFHMFASVLIIILLLLMVVYKETMRGGG